MTFFSAPPRCIRQPPAELRSDREAVARSCERLAAEDARDRRVVGRVRHGPPRGHLLPPRRLAARASREVFRHTTHFLYAEADGRIDGRAAAGACQEPAVRQRAGRLPFAVYGGVAADDAEAAPALEAEAQALARRLGVDHLELRNVAARASGLADAGSLRHLPQGHPARRGSQHAGHPAQAARDGAQGHQERPAQRDRRGVDRFFALYADNVHRHGTPALPQALLPGAAARVRRRLRGADRRRCRTASRSAAC